MNNELDDSPPLSEGPETWARSCPTPWAEPAWWWARAPSPSRFRSKRRLGMRPDPHSAITTQINIQKQLAKTMYERLRLRKQTIVY